MATNTEKIVVQVVVQGDKQLGNLEKKTKTATKSTSNLTKEIKKMAAGYLAAGVVFNKVNQAIGGAIRTFRDFEFQMAKVQAISGANNKEFTELSKTAQELGRTTFFTAQQVAELQTNFAKLGFTTEEILDAQDATLALATATDSDLARAATVAGAAVRGFGLDASETSRVVDVMTVAFTSSAMDLEKWQTGMTKVAPIAKSAGFSIEETAAIMSKLTDAGIEASIAGTSMRNILLAMQDPNSKLVKSFGSTIHTFDQLLPAMKKFISEGGSMTEVMKVVEKRQAAAFEQMLTSSNATNDLRIKMDNAAGTADRLAKIIGDTFEGAMKRLTSATQGLAIVILEDFGGAMKSAVDSLAKFFNRLSESSDAIQSVLKFIANLTKFIGLYKAAQIAATIATKAQTAAIVAYQLATGTATIATKRMIVSVRRLNNTILKNPYLAAGALLVALATDMFNLRIETDETKSAWKELNDEIYGDIKRTKEREETIELLKNEVVTARELAKAKESSLKLQREIDAEEKSREQVERDAIKRAEEMHGWTQDLKDAYVARTLAGHDQDIQLKKQQKSELDLAISKAKVLDQTRTQTNATQNLISVEEELLNFRFNMWRQGDLNEKQSAKLRQDLIRQEIKNIKLLLEQEKFLFLSREDLLLKLHELEEQLAADDKKRKDKSLEEDIVRAALSGQNALESVKSVIRARIMEAVATQIKEIIATVPFPANLIVAAGAGMMIAKLVDKGMAMIPSEFGNGGVVEYANGGMVHGRSHAQGGEKFAVGGRVVELEGGEAVINKRSTAMFRNQLSAMNAAGGGVKFADGGLLNMPSFSQQQFNALGQNQMMGAMGSASKVVVVEADITDSQNAVSVIQSSATI